MAKHRRIRVSRDVLSFVMSELGKLGGQARAESLTPERRRKIARMGGAATKARRARMKTKG